MIIFRCTGSALRQFGERRRSLPQGVGGCNADVHFPPVAEVHRVLDERHDLVQVKHHVGESPSVVDFHFYPLAFPKEVVVYPEFATCVLGPRRD